MKEILFSDSTVYDFNTSARVPLLGLVTPFAAEAPLGRAAEAAMAAAVVDFVRTKSAQDLGALFCGGEAIVVVRSEVGDAGIGTFSPDFIDSAAPSSCSVFSTEEVTTLEVAFDFVGA